MARYGPLAGRSGGPRFPGDKDTYLVEFRKMMRVLNIQIGAIENHGLNGLMKAAAFIRNQTETTPPITPVDFGNLQSSFFAVTAKGKVVNDKWNRGFRDNTRTGLKATQMKSEHIDAINEGKAMCKSTPNFPLLVLGYSANYAGFVHEMVGANFNPDSGVKGSRRRRPGAGPKWFEINIKNNSDKILKIIAKNIQIK